MIEEEKLRQRKLEEQQRQKELVSRICQEVVGLNPGSFISNTILSAYEL